MSNKQPLISATCLVVSNCKSCWDTSSKLAFISDSIPDYLDVEWLKTIDHVILDGPWESREYRIKSQQFVVERVTRYRKELSPILNLAMGLDYGEKAWGFLLDSWLMCFASVVYDRVHKLENARNQLGDVYLNCFRDDLPLVLTTIDFVENCLDDWFNQQLLGDIATALGIRVDRCVDYFPENDVLPKNIVAKSLKYKAYKAVAPLLRPMLRWWSKRRKPTVILDGYFPFAKTILLFLRSMGKVLIIPSNFLLGKASELKEDKSLRVLLKVTEEDRFDLVANNLFAKSFPVSLLEGLRNYSEKISELEVIPILGSAVGFHYNEEFKILASRVIENGNKIIGFQHGGNYNFEKNEFFCAGYFERLNSDKFYRWREKSFSGKLLPTAKLVTLSSYKEVRKRKSDFVDILFVSTNNNRFIYRQQSDCADNYLKKIIAQQNFYLRLNEKMKNSFLLRPHPRDNGWRYKERWLDLTEGEIRFDPNRKFHESLMSCRIFVTDHISTTWLEAFYAGVPVLLFFDVDRYEPLDEVRSIFEGLQRVGVFHLTPESAVSFLNENYNTIEDWWGMPDTKAAVDRVKNYFFNDSGDFVGEWTQELVSLRSRALKGELNL